MLCFFNREICVPSMEGKVFVAVGFILGEWNKNIRIWRHPIANCQFATMQSNQFLTSILLLLLSLLTVSASISTQDEVEDESGFSYETGSETGPGNWGKIKAEWKACGKGKLQSPIDLRNKRVFIRPNFGELKKRYRPAHAVLKNRGHDVALEWKGDAGRVELSGFSFKLQQCHWHAPSEHTLNGTRFQMELHMVHKSDWGKIAVLGNTYKYGAPDPFLARVLKDITSIPAGEEKELGIMDPNHINYWSKKYYRYIGSLTTPPCTEGVIWTISKKVKTVSKEQVEALRSAVHDGHKGNARPTQKLNERALWLYMPFQPGRSS